MDCEWVYWFTRLLPISHKHGNYICMSLDLSVLLEAFWVNFGKRIHFQLYSVLCDFAAEGEQHFLEECISSVMFASNMR